MSKSLSPKIFATVGLVLVITLGLDSMMAVAWGPRGHMTVGTTGPATRYDGSFPLRSDPMAALTCGQANDSGLAISKCPAPGIKIRRT